MPQLTVWPYFGNYPGLGSVPTFGNVPYSDAAGSLYISQERPNPVYATAASFVVGANPTDVFLLRGNAVRSVRIHRILVASSLNAVSLVYVERRSTADTGGTSSAVGIFAHDPNDTASLSSAAFYTANPVLGTLVSVWEACVLPVNGVLNFIYGQYDKALCLHGTSDYCVINLNGSAVTGTVSCGIHFSEVV